MCTVTKLPLLQRLWSFNVSRPALSLVHSILEPVATRQRDSKPRTLYFAEPTAERVLGARRGPAASLGP